MSNSKELFKLPDNVYDGLKWVTMVFLPAVAALYLSMGSVFNLPYPEQVSATITALVVFLGVFLQINSSRFKFVQIVEKGVEIFENIKLKFIASDGVYDVLKWVATILLPAISALYFAIAEIWNLPYGEQVASVLAAIVMFMTAVLQISSLEYKASMHIQAVRLRKVNMKVVRNGFLALSGDAYDIIKFIAQGLLPGLATFYVALSQIWNLPFGGEVSATIMAVVVFINALLQISSSKYKSILNKSSNSR